MVECSAAEETRDIFSQDFLESEKENGGLHLSSWIGPKTSKLQAAAAYSLYEAVFPVLCVSFVIWAVL